MATGNFRTMDRFPLIVAEDIFTKVCPKCGTTMDNGADECDCGTDLSEIEGQYSEILNSARRREMEDVADDLNDSQPFFEVKVMSGYYSGVQFYVDEKYVDVAGWSEDDAMDEFGWGLDEMLRRFDDAVKTITSKIREAKERLGMMELCVAARLDNGAVLYSDVA